MALTSGPFALTPGVPVNIPSPQNSPLQAVVVSNLSPYQLRLQVAGLQVWLQPWMENLFPLPDSHQALVVNPSLPAGSVVAANSPAQVSATWYAPGETPAGAWPISLTAAALAAAIAGIVTTQQSIDLLTTTTGSANPTLLVSGVAKNAYAALLCVVSQITPGNTVRGDFVDSGVASWGSAEDFAFQSPGQLGRVELMVPCACNPGDTINCTLTQAGTLPGNNVSANLYGLTQSALPQRKDGRARPSNSRIGQIQTSAAGNANIVAAPGANTLRLVVSKLKLFQQTTPAGSEIQVTKNGVNVNPCICNGAPQIDEADFSEGLALDHNTAIVLVNTAGGTATGFAVYDVVFGV